MKLLLRIRSCANLVFLWTQRWEKSRVANARKKGRCKTEAPSSTKAIKINRERRNCERKLIFRRSIKRHSRASFSYAERPSAGEQRAVHSHTYGSWRGDCPKLAIFYENLLQRWTGSSHQCPMWPKPNALEYLFALYAQKNNMCLMDI